MVAVIETAGTEETSDLNTCAPAEPTCGGAECTAAFCGCKPSVEVPVLNVPQKPSFESLVLERFHNKCANCGEGDRLAVGMIVPEDHGGQKVVENGTVLCRTCEFAAASGAADDRARQMVTFWMTREMHDNVMASGFPSATALIRYLVTRFVEDPNRFDDMVEPSGDNDVKVNVRIDTIAYKRFKDIVEIQSMTVTGALKALISLFILNTRS